MAFRTQKISQMTPKGANLEATDLIEVSTIESGSYVTRSITGQEIIDAAVGNVDWGDIGGTLSNQTDLQTALNAKQDSLVSGTNIKTLEGQSLLGSGNIDLSKSDVGLANVDNTSDLNKPISTATQTALNAKQNTLVSGSNIKTVFNQSVVGSGNVGYLARSFTQSVGSNASGETQLLQLTIPANTFSSTDKLAFFAIFSKTGTATTTTYRVKITTSSSMPSGSGSTIALYTGATTTAFLKINRELYISGGNLKGFPFTVSGTTDAASSTSTLGSVSFDVTQTQYVYVSATPSSTTTDVTYLEAFEIRNI